jgi:hypothetical protein
MGGKAILFVVLGFSLTFLLIGNNFNRMSLSAMDNMTYYACRQISHNIALTGANIGCSHYFFNPSWTAGYSNVPCQGGSFTITVQKLDTLRNINKITTVSTFSGYYSGYSSIVYHDTIMVTFQPFSFANFTYYSLIDNGGTYWTTGDTLSGRVHSQDKLYIQGNPYFYGYVTTLNGLVYHGGTNAPVFAGGYQAGVSIPISNIGVSNDQTAALSNGKYFTGHDTVYLNFASDSISYRYTWNGVDSTRKLSTLAPNGVIFINQGTVRLKGVVKGQYTVACSGKSSTIGGSMWLDDDLVFTSNPLTNPNCTDLLGLVCQNNCNVTDNVPNATDINIDASIYCQVGSFQAENYNSMTSGIRGSINVIGGIIQNNKGQVNTTQGTDIKTGYNRNYKFDTRLIYSSPPVFPFTGTSQIISWYESGLNSTDRNLY